METQIIMAAIGHPSNSASKRWRAGIKGTIGSNSSQLCRYERTRTEQRSKKHRSTAQSYGNSILYQASVRSLGQRGRTGKTKMGALCRRNSRWRGSCHRNLRAAPILGTALARRDGSRGSQGTGVKWCAYSVAARWSDFQKIQVSPGKTGSVKSAWLCRRAVWDFKGGAWG